MQVVLIMFKADGGRKSFSLPRAITVIGRREDCDLRIPLGEISRKHCRFIAEDGELRLEDLGSSNRTFHNGVRIRQAVIKPGDSVRIGPVSFVVQIDGVPDDDSIQPPTNNIAENDTSIAPAIPPSHGGPPELPETHTPDDAAFAHLQAAEEEHEADLEDDFDDVNIDMGKASDHSKPAQ